MTEETTHLWERQPYERELPFLYKKLYLSLPPFIKGKPKIYQHIIDFLENKDNIQEWVLNPENITIAFSSFHFLKEKVNENIPIPTIDDLNHYASKWKWMEASRQRQNYYDNLEKEIEREEFKKLNKEVRIAHQELFKGMEENAKALREDKQTKPSTKAHAYNSLSGGFSTLYKDMRLSYGLSTDIVDNNLDGELNVESEITVDNTTLFNGDNRKEAMARIKELINSK